MDNPELVAEQAALEASLLANQKREAQEEAMRVMQEHMAGERGGEPLGKDLTGPCSPISPRDLTLRHLLHRAILYAVQSEALITRHYH